MYFLISPIADMSAKSVIFYGLLPLLIKYKSGTGDMRIFLLFITIREVFERKTANSMIIRKYS